MSACTSMQQDAISHPGSWPEASLIAPLVSDWVSLPLLLSPEVRCTRSGLGTAASAVVAW